MFILIVKDIVIIFIILIGKMPLRKYLLFAVLNFGYRHFKAVARINGCKNVPVNVRFPNNIENLLF